MAFNCPNCNKEINKKYINESENNENINCPSCRVVLVESNKTKILTVAIAIIPIFLLASYVESFMFRMLMIFSWAFFVNIQVRPIIAGYEIKK